MSDAINKKSGWKSKLAHELFQYWINFLYLVFFFGAFTWYRRLVLAEYHISYLHYGAAVIEALILAKVILIGDALRLERGLEERPLIIPTLYNAVVFSLFVGVFGILEHTIEGLMHHQGVAGGLDELRRSGKDELLARCLVTFFAFIPFFGFRELGRVLGEGKLHELFFRGKTGTRPEPSGGSSAGLPEGSRG